MLLLLLINQISIPSQCSKNCFDFALFPFYKQVMEQHLDRVLSEIVTQQDTVGAIIANRQGLCMGAKGNIHPIVCGIGMAISAQVAKLEPNISVPATICLYSGNKRCIIQKNGEITGIIYKQSSSTSSN